MQLGAVAVLAVALLQASAVTPLEGARAPHHAHPCQRVVAQAPHPCPPVALAGTVSVAHDVAQGRRRSESQAAVVAAAVARVVKTKLAAATAVLVVRARQQQLP